MVKVIRKMSIALLLLGCVMAPVSSEVVTRQKTTLPLYVIMPPNSSKINKGKCFRELFEHPEQWTETRKMTDVILYPDWAFKDFSDEELRKWFAMMKQWGIKLELEVGALKEWGKTGQGTFDRSIVYWDRIIRLGGEIHALAFDEPRVCARKYIKDMAPDFKGTPDEYAVQETAVYIELVRKKYPHFILGNIAAHPTESLEHNIEFIEALDKILTAKGVKSLEFYRIDPNWIVYNVRPHEGNWQDMIKLEKYCKKKNIAFSMIYWSPHDAMARKLKIHDDSIWYTDVMTQGYMYLSVNGQPDQFVLESWVDSPSTSVPETAEFTFTRSALDFGRKFVKPKERILPNY